LHDGIGQSLAVTKVKLGALKRAIAGYELIQPINEIQEIIEQTIQITRTLTFDLSPPILYELGFEPAVEWLTDQIQERHGIHTTCEDDMNPKPLHDDIRVVLFQAVRELLVNVVKHAKAQHINVSLSRENNSIRIHVRDDGMGFDTSKLNIHNGSTCGFGLFSIRERLDLLGGRLELQSEAGHGTAISIIAPLKQEHKELR
jgi:signal transduction histidine kinase